MTSTRAVDRPQENGAASDGRRPKVGIFGLTGCAGDQLAVLNCEDELLRVVELLDVRDFLMASSANDTECELDIALVEGAVVGERDAERLARIRTRSSTLVALGTCAVWGGVAAMDRNVDRASLIRDIYGEQGREFKTASARPLHEVVDVDFRITGCPVEKQQLLAAIATLLNGDPPLFPQYPVCTECRVRENRCLLIDDGEFCLGPVTVAGCAARCPTLHVGCIGCRGPAVDANFESTWELFREKGFSDDTIRGKLTTFAALPDDEGLGVVRTP